MISDKKQLIKDNHALLAEWDYEKNAQKQLFPETTFCGSNKKAWWICSLGHSWEATIYERANGSGCPYCANKKVLAGYNDLATTNPELVAEWNYSKNTALKIDIERDRTEISKLIGAGEYDDVIVTDETN